MRAQVLGELEVRQLLCRGQRERVSLQGCPIPERACISPSTSSSAGD